MAADWLLIETFGGHRREPTVIAVGRSPRSMVPLRKILDRSPFLKDYLTLIARVVETGTSTETVTNVGQRRLIGRPLKTYGGHIHGVYAWMGRVHEEPPPQDPAGAWHVNITRHVSSRSDDLLRLYGTKAENWRNEHDLAELFAYGRLQTNSDESKALALIVNATPGTEHQATWTVKRDDGVRRAVNFACRCVEAPNDQGHIELVVRGITHDIGPAESVMAAPPAAPVLLAQQVVAAEAVPGRWRAIVDLRTMRLLRWLDDPPPRVAWKLDTPHKPAIHRRDLRTAVQMSDTLATSGHVRALLRLRTEDGEWVQMMVTAALMLLDQHTTAALVTLTMPDDDRVV
ncbi:GAF domain-containing protein [Saccharothrix syringae]|uniref:Uncharacterized protein n=1 Tax=Saccharothrix syringae TaxID=103733 RepID=A0A5Q0GX02_SACSY|nr:GAF domain-containing protein [Saccharothrix syringae]QFZ18478.1 hypothetical protein EKG83_14210 [Saccharothrix syringae]